MKESKQSNHPNSFEEALFIALTKNGFVIPTMENQIENFESKLEDLGTEMPPEFIVPQLENMAPIRKLKVEKLDEHEEFYLKVATSKKNNPKKDF